MSNHMKIELQDDLEKIDARLMVCVTTETVIRTTTRYVGLTRNYAKGSGDLLIAFYGRTSSRDLFATFERYKR